MEFLQLPRQALQWEGRQRWRPMLGNLRQMLLADSLVEQRANWQIGGDSMSPKLSGRGLAGMREDATADSELATSSVNRSCASMVFLRGDLSADEASSVTFHAHSVDSISLVITNLVSSSHY